MALAQALHTDLTIALDRERVRIGAANENMPDNLAEVAAIAGEAFRTLWLCVKTAKRIIVNSLRAAWFSAAFGWSAFFGLVGWHAALKGMIQ